eukprot:4471881-Amphidinium_carterae.1
MSANKIANFESLWPTIRSSNAVFNAAMEEWLLHAAAMERPKLTQTMLHLRRISGHTRNKMN